MTTIKARRSYLSAQEKADMSVPRTTIGRLRTDYEDLNFDVAQKAAIVHGQEVTDDLKERVRIALGHGDLTVEPFRHYYIASPAGGGKTYTVTEMARELNVDLVKIQGATSIAGLIRQIAMQAYYKQDEQITVLIDDCDFLFHNPEGQEVMKGALDADRNVIIWNKVMSTQIKQLESSTVENDHKLAEALRFYTPPNEVGITIPTDNMRFIDLSNQELFPSRGAHNGSVRKINEGAIRSRFGGNYKYYNLTPAQNWGWVAYILLRTDFPNMVLTVDQKTELLEWAWNKLDVLEELSIRSVMGMAASMINYPKSYRDKWGFTLGDRRAKA